MNQRLMRTALSGAALAGTLLGPTLACTARYPATPILAAPDPAQAYRFANFPATPANTDSLFVVLVLSGGGTRAASLSYGVMRQLAATALPGVPGAARSLLDEVDVISSVSGGSFTAAYLAVHGWQGMRRFEQEFLKWDAQGTLKRAFVKGVLTGRVLSPRFSRVDLAAELWDERLFQRRTFGDLVRARRRPFVILNASDMGAAESFSFTDEQFAPMCADLRGVAVGRAVAASSAFPGLLNPVTLENHAAACAFAADSFALQNYDIPGFNVGTFDTERYLSARHFLSYDDPARRYIHLLDGGLTDNLGLRPVLRALGSSVADLSIQGLIDAGRVRQLVVVVVNARTMKDSDIERSPSPPGLLQVFQTAVSKPMGNYTRESVYRLFELADRMQEARAGNARSNTPVPGVFPAVTAIEVSFEAVPDSAARRWFLNLPTSFALPSATVDSLVKAGACLLRQSPRYLDLVRTLGARVADSASAPVCWGERGR